MIYLIDASVFVFRAWFSIPDSMTDEQRNPVNAVYGFARFLGDFLEDRSRPFHTVGSRGGSLLGIDPVSLAFERVRWKPCR